MSSSSRTWRQRVFRIATAAQTISSATLGSVLIVHLAAPVVASLTGPAAVDMSNQMILLGREWYQRAWIEPVLVYGSFSLHILSSLVRRALLHRPTMCWPWHWRWETWHSVCGWILTPLVCAHVLVNRIVPQQSSLPISGLSPSELDMSYVSYALAASPITTWSVYVLLSVTGAVHIVGGAMKLMRRRKMRVRAQYGLTTAFALAAMLLVGTSAIAQDGLASVAPTAMERMAACYRQVVPWRWVGI